MASGGPCKSCFSSWHLKWLLLSLVAAILIITYAADIWSVEMEFTGKQNTPPTPQEKLYVQRAEKVKTKKNTPPSDVGGGEESAEGGLGTTSTSYLGVADSIPAVRVAGVDCSRIFANDQSEIKRAGKFQSSHPVDVIPDAQFIAETRDCKAFSVGRSYVPTPVSQEEADFPIAFSMLMFKDVWQMEKLLRAIYRPQNYYCLHVDSNSRAIFRKAVRAIAGCFDNVFLASRSVRVEWGTFSVLEPELICMEDLLKYRKWKYFINLTGQEFPLKTNWDLVKILKAFNGSNNMEGTVARRNEERLKFVYHGFVPTDTRKEAPPVDVTLTKGSVHIAATRAFVHYVINDKRALTFRNWVKDTGVPDETFFSTLNHSPQLGVPGAYLGKPETDNKVYPFLTRFKNWGSGPFNWPCQGERVRMVCIFGVGDLPLLASRPELFANKFYWDYQPLALQCLEELHYNRTRQEALGQISFNAEMYSTYDFVRRHV